MKICICTTSIRPVPTTYPPLGSMAIIQSLRDFGATESGYFNVKSMPFTPIFLNTLPLRFHRPLLAVGVALVAGEGLKGALGLIAEHVYRGVKRLFAGKIELPDKSLRKVVDIKANPQSKDHMIPLQLGR